MKHLVLIILLLGTYFLHAQTQTFNTLQIDSIVMFIDSTCVRAGITDGIIKNPESNLTVGGFSDWYYTDSLHNHLLKVICEQSMTDYSFTSYYFNNDKLIMILIKREDDEEDNHKITSTGKYYIQNQKLILKQDETDLNFDLSYYLKTAKRYLSDSTFWGH